MKKSFDSLIMNLLEADLGPADPAASSNQATAKALGGSTPSPASPSSTTTSSTGQSKFRHAVDKSSLGAAGRTATMAMGRSPMDRWDAPVDAANVYSLDPRGASSHVVAKFMSGAASEDGEEMANADQTPEGSAMESFSFHVLYKKLMENDATQADTVEDEVDKQEEERKEYIAQKTQEYIDQEQFQVGQQYEYTSASGENKLVVITALPGQEVPGIGTMAPNYIRVQQEDGREYSSPIIRDSSWVYTIGSQAGQNVPAQQPEEIIPPEGGPDETSEGETISADNPEWVTSMENRIISARENPGGASPIYLPSFASADYNDDMEAARDKAMFRAGGEKIFNSLNSEEQQDKIQTAYKDIQRKKEKPNIDLNNLHEQLKIAFKDRGLYCGTIDQFNKFKAGQWAAIGDVAKGAMGALQQTGGLRDVGTN